MASYRSPSSGTTRRGQGRGRVSNPTAARKLGKASRSRSKVATRTKKNTRNLTPARSGSAGRARTRRKAR